MKLSQKLLLFALAVALLPLAATGFTLLASSERALRERVEAQHEAAATALSGRISAALEDTADRIKTVLELVDLASLSVKERRGVLILLYRQSPSISVAILKDRSGAVLAPDVFLDDKQALPKELESHPTGSPRDADRLRELTPFPDQTGAPVVSPPYFPGDGSARVALAVAALMDREPVVASVELVLTRALLEAPGINTGEGSEIYLVDEAGRAMIHPTTPAGTALNSLHPVAHFLSSGRAGALRYHEGRSAELAAVAPVAGIGGAVVVTQPESIAFTVVREMRWRILFWITATLLVVLLTGWLFAERLRRRLDTLTRGARSFGARELDHVIELDTRDELSQLGDTMNSMARDLSRSLEQLEDWNRTLEERVKQRTSELERAQAQLVTQAKMAAIGQLGAGVAHEINNPLSGVLGFAQLLKREIPEDDSRRASLEQIESAAKRCRAVTNKLLRYSERSEGGAVVHFALTEVIGETVDLLEHPMRSDGVKVAIDLRAENDIVSGVPGEMSVALINLLLNARNAMPRGGTVTLSTRSKNGRAFLDVQDSGSGIPEQDLPRIFDPFFTRKQEWQGLGLGLSIVYRIITDMQGEIRVAQTGPTGTTIEIALPLARDASRASA